MRLNRFALQWTSPFRAHVDPCIIYSVDDPKFALQHQLPMASSAHCWLTPTYHFRIIYEQCSVFSCKFQMKRDDWHPAMCGGLPTTTDWDGSRDCTWIGIPLEMYASLFALISCFFFFFSLDISPHVSPGEFWQKWIAQKGSRGIFPTLHPLADGGKDTFFTWEKRMRLTLFVVLFGM